MELTKAASDVLAERARQISAEGRTPEHDDRQEFAEMSMAASAYADEAALALQGAPPDILSTADDPPDPWPPGWDFKPGQPRRMLVKAAALLLAEIERLDRMSERSA